MLKNPPCQSDVFISTIKGQFDDLIDDYTNTCKSYRDSRIEWENKISITRQRNECLQKSIHDLEMQCAANDQAQESLKNAQDELLSCRSLIDSQSQLIQNLTDMKMSDTYVDQVKSQEIDFLRRQNDILRGQESSTRDRLRGISTKAEEYALQNLKLRHKIDELEENREINREQYGIIKCTVENYAKSIEELQNSKIKLYKLFLSLYDHAPDCSFDDIQQFGDLSRDDLINAILNLQTKNKLLQKRLVDDPAVERNTKNAHQQYDVQIVMEDKSESSGDESSSSSDTQMKLELDQSIKKIKSYQQEVDNLNDKIDSLESEKQILRDKLDQKSHSSVRITELTDEMVRLRSQNMEIKYDNKRLTTDNEEYLAKLGQLEENCESVHKELEQTKRLLDTLGKDNKNLTEEKNVLINQLNEVNNELNQIGKQNMQVAESERRNEELILRLEELEDQIEVNNVDIEELKDHSDWLAKQLDESHKINRHLTEKAQHDEAKHLESDVKINQLEKIIQETYSAQSVHLQNLQNIEMPPIKEVEEEYIKEDSTFTDDLKNQNEQMKAKLEESSLRMELLLRDLNAKDEELQKVTLDTQGEIEELNDKINKEKQINESLAARIEELKILLNEYEMKINEHKSGAPKDIKICMLSDDQTDVHKLDRDSDILQLQSTIECLNEKHMSDLRARDLEIENLHNEISLSRGKEIEIQDEIEKFKTEISLKEREYLTLKNKMNTLSRDSESKWKTTGEKDVKIIFSDSVENEHADEIQKEIERVTFHYAKTLEEKDAELKEMEISLAKCSQREDELNETICMLNTMSADSERENKLLNEKYQQVTADYREIKEMYDKIGAMMSWEDRDLPSEKNTNELSTFELFVYEAKNLKMDTDRKLEEMRSELEEKNIKIQETEKHFSLAAENSRNVEEAMSNEICKLENKIKALETSSDGAPKDIPEKSDSETSDSSIYSPEKDIKIIIDEELENDPTLNEMMKLIKEKEEAIKNLESLNENSKRSNESIAAQLEDLKDRFYLKDEENQELKREFADLYDEAGELKILTENLASQISEHKAMIARREEEIETLKDTIWELRSRIEMNVEADVVVRSEDTNLMRVGREIGEITGKLEILTNENSDLKSNFEDSQMKVNRISADYIQLGESMEKTKASLKEKEEEIDGLTRDVESYKNQLDDERDKFSKLQTRIDKTLEEMEEQKWQTETLLAEQLDEVRRTSLAEYEEENRKMILEINSCKGMIEQLEANNEEKQETVTALTHMLEKEGEEFDKLQEDFKRLSSDLETHRKSEVILGKTVKVKDEVILLKEKEISELAPLVELYENAKKGESAKEGEIKLLVAKLENERTEFEKLQKNFNILCADLELLKDSIKMLKETLRERDGDIALRDERILELTIFMESCRAGEEEISAITATLEKERREFDKLQENFNTLSSDLEILKSSLQMFEATVKERDAEIGRNEDEISRLRDCLKSSERDIGRSVRTNEVSLSCIRLENERRELELLQTKFNALCRDIERLTNAQKVLEETLKERDEEITRKDYKILELLNLLKLHKTGKAGDQKLTHLLGDLERRLIALNREHDKQAELNNEIMERISVHQNAEQTLTTTLSYLNEVLEGRRAGDGAEIEETIERNNRIKEDLVRLSNELHRKSDGIKTLHLESDSQVRENQLLSSHRDSLRDELAGIKRQIQMQKIPMDVKIAFEDGQKGRPTKCEEKGDDLIVHYASVIDNLERENQVLVRKLGEEKRKVESYKENLENMQRNIDHLQSNLGATRLEDLEAIHQDIGRNTIQELIDQLQKLNDSLEEKVRIYTEKCYEMEGEIGRLQGLLNNFPKTVGSSHPGAPDVRMRLVDAPRLERRRDDASLSSKGSSSSRRTPSHHSGEPREAGGFMAGSKTEIRSVDRKGCEIAEMQMFRSDMMTLQEAHSVDYENYVSQLFSKGEEEERSNEDIAWSSSSERGKSEPDRACAGGRTESSSVSISSTSTLQSATSTSISKTSSSSSKGTRSTTL